VDSTQTRADFAEHVGDDIWVHYSNVPQVTINPKGFHQDPAGVYLFPTDFPPNPNWLTMKYKFEMKLDPSTQVLDLSILSVEEAKKILDQLGLGAMADANEYFSDPKRDHDERIDTFWEIMQNEFILRDGKRPGAWNKALRNLGYDAVFDDIQVIHTAEEQLLVLDTSKIKVLKREDLADTGFDDLQKVMARVKDLVEPYGKVEVTEPKRDKMEQQWSKVALKGEIRVYDGPKPHTGHYVTWTVSTKTFQKSDSRPSEIRVSLSHTSLRFDHSVGVTIERFQRRKKPGLDFTDLDKDVKWAMDKIWAREPRAESAVMDEAGVEDTLFPYFHVSDHPETPSIRETTKRGEHYHDPYGIYLFPKGEGVDVLEWSTKKYRWDARLKPGAKIKYISNFTTHEKWTLLKKARILTGLDFYAALRSGKGEDEIEFEHLQEIIEGGDGDSVHPTEADMQEVFKEHGLQDVMWFRALRAHFSDRGKFTEFWKAQGFDGIEDDVGAVFAGEPQLIVFNPNIIKWGPREENESDSKVYRLQNSSKDDLEEKYAKNDNAYLSWPVTIDGDDSLHVTCKFIGTDPFSVDEVVGLIQEGSPDGTDFPVSNELSWEPITFDTENDGKVKVLELKGVPQNVVDCHDALWTIRQDDYPDYKPHVTVPDKLWERIKAEGLTPQDLGMQVGPLRLEQAGELLYQWGSAETKAHFEGQGPIATSDTFQDAGMVGDNWGSQASGILFRSDDGVLLLKRAGWVQEPFLWGIPGGAVPVDPNGAPMDPKASAIKESEEEMGGMPPYRDTNRSVVFRKGDFRYTTYLFEVDEEFSPVLNDEHTDALWFPVDQLPPDIHPGAKWAIEQFAAIGSQAVQADAPAPEEFKSMRFYHGTSDEKKAQGIWKQGILPDLSTTPETSVARPVAGRVYMAANLRDAIPYVLGGAFAGSTIPKSYFKGSPHGYLFVVDGASLGDIQPDEDQVGRAVHDRISHNEKDLAWIDKYLDDIEAEQPEFDTEIEDEKGNLVPNSNPFIHHQNLLKQIKFGEYAGWIRAGHVLLPLLTDAEKMSVIKRYGNVAHHGKVLPIEMWQIDKKDSKELKEDGSNFFEVAKLVNQRAPVKEKVHAELVEAGLSPVLYHVTDHAEEILKQNRFILRPAGSSSDKTGKPSEHFYFLSTMRVPSGGYRGKGNEILVLDGTKLGQKYKGSPYHYWGADWVDRARKDTDVSDPNVYDETEDRVWSRESTISNATDYIEEIHLYLYSMADRYKTEPDFATRRNREVRKTILAAKKAGIPVFVYTDRAAFKLLNKSKAVPLKDLDLSDKPYDPEHEWMMKRRGVPSGQKSSDKSLKAFIEMYHAKEYATLSKDAKHEARYLWDRALPEVLDNEMKQASPEQKQKLTDIWRKLGINTAKEYIAWLTEKMHKLDQEEMAKRKATTSALEWKDVIRGEWWIDPSGHAEFADQDVGESGHEAIAVRHYLNKYEDELKEELDPDADLDTLTEMYFGSGISDEVGERVMGPIWQELKADARLTYAKHEGMILAINTSFAAYTVTNQTIKAIQDFLGERLSEFGEDVTGDTEMMIEEFSTGKSHTISISAFLGLKYAAQLWKAISVLSASKARQAEIDDLRIEEPWKSFEILGGYGQYEGEKCFRVVAIKNGQNVAALRLKLEGDDFVSDNIWVLEPYRRQGLMTQMMNLAEAELGVTLSPSQDRTGDAKEFWKNRRVKGVVAASEKIPAILYHGSPTQGLTDLFYDPAFTRRDAGTLVEGDGVYLTESYRVARGYAGAEGSIYEVQLKATAVFLADKKKSYLDIYRQVKKKFGIDLAKMKHTDWDIKRCQEGRGSVTNFGDSIRHILLNDEGFATDPANADKPEEIRDFINQEIAEWPVVRYLDANIDDGKTHVYVVRQDTPGQHIKIIREIVVMSNEDEEALSSGPAEAGTSPDVYPLPKDEAVPNPIDWPIPHLTGPNGPTTAATKRQIVAYHGSNRPIQRFDLGCSSQGIVWFSENKEKILSGESGASSIKYLIEVVLTVSNPAGWDEYEKLMLAQIKQEGFDSIHLDDDWVIFDPKNIKITKVTDLSTVQAATESQAWILTLPKTISWQDYEKELRTVADGSQVMNYRLPYKPKAQVGERCYVTWQGQVQGWMEITGIEHREHGFTCSTTGINWPAGWYLQRSGFFHAEDGPALPGFRGLRRYTPEIPSQQSSQLRGAHSDLPPIVLDFFGAWYEYKRQHAEELLKNPELVAWLQQFEPLSDLILYRALHIHPEMLERWKAEGYGINTWDEFKLNETRHTSWSLTRDAARPFMFMGEDGEYGILLEAKFSPDQMLFRFDRMDETLGKKIEQADGGYIHRENEKEVIVKPGNPKVRIVEICPDTDMGGKCNEPSKIVAGTESFLPDTLVMLDAEMTGVVPDRDKLLQIAMTMLKLKGNQYVEEGEPLVLYMQHDGKPQNDFQKQYLSKIFERCNESTLQPGEAKEAICQWLGEQKGKVTPAGDCVPTDVDFLRHAGCIDCPDIGDEGPIPGTFHYEYFDMNGIKALARHKMGKKEDVKEMAGYDSEGAHDALVDCRNQTLELNHYMLALLGEPNAASDPVPANPPTRVEAAKKRRPKVELPEAVMPTPKDDFKLEDSKRAAVWGYEGKARGCVTFEDFQELLSQILLDLQLTEDYRKSIAGILNSLRKVQGLDLL
jgi:oligoribonuclease (3'-5' exoribonuclease)